MFDRCPLQSDTRWALHGVVPRLDDLGDHGVGLRVCVGGGEVGANLLSFDLILLSGTFATMVRPKLTRPAIYTRTQMLCRWRGSFLRPRP